MRALKITAVMATALVIGACSGMGPTTFLHPEFNFAYVERVGVIPFENLTKDQGAGARATRFFIAELLAAEAFDVVEPGEVARVLEKHMTSRTGDLTEEQAINVGKELGAQAVFLGSVGESSTVRSGAGSSNVVTLVVRMVETDTGQTVWSTTHTEGGRGFWSVLFGTGERSMSEVMRRCVKKSIKTLIR